MRRRVPKARRGRLARAPDERARLRRTTPAGLHQTLTFPLHRELAPGTLRAIFRQASRFVGEEDLDPAFFTGG